MIENGSARMGMTVARKVPQEQEDHHHHQAQGQHHGELHVMVGLANGFRAVVEGVHLTEAGSSQLKTGSGP